MGGLQVSSQDLLLVEKFSQDYMNKGKHKSFEAMIFLLLLLIQKETIV